MDIDNFSGDSSSSILPTMDNGGGGMGIGLFSMLFGAPLMGGSNGSSNGGQYEMIKFGITILIVTWVVSLARSYLTSLIDLIKNRFYFTARLSYPDSMFVYFLEWLSAQETIVGTRGVSVMTRYQNVESEGGGTMDVKLLPIGTQWVWYKGYLISVVRETSSKRSFDGIKDDNLDVTVFGGNKDVINDILDTAVEYSVTLNKDKTKIYSLDQSASFWECIACQNKRLVDSVFLDENISEKVVSDLSNFIHGKKWYIDTGVPYRRGYLLYGPPGSGKTSFILSMAGSFGKSISIMNMNKGINDGNIHSIIQKCNKDTILVLEDIDAVFVKRKSQSENNVLTFSALLNAIDGLASSDGRILMMTTNHLDRLSPALIRPGRIDLKVKFDFASSHQLELMFKRFFDTKYHYLIKEIIEKLENHLISTAQLQGWFIIHRDNPLSLLPTCNDFIDQCTMELSSNDIITNKMVNKEDQTNELSNQDSTSLINEKKVVIKKKKSNEKSILLSSISPTSTCTDSPISTESLDNSNIYESSSDNSDESNLSGSDDDNIENNSKSTTRKRR